MTFAEKLVKLRKLKSITQDEFASAVGVSRQAVYKWECGQSYPEVAKLLEIKALFGISIDDLLDETYEVVLPEKKRRRRKAADAAPAAEVKEEAAAEVKEEAPAKEEKPAPVKEAAPAPAEEERPAAPAPEVKEEAPAEKEEVKEEAPAPAKEAAPAAKTEEKKSFFEKLFGKK